MLREDVLGKIGGVGGGDATADLSEECAGMLVSLHLAQAHVDNLRLPSFAKPPRPTSLADLRVFLAETVTEKPSAAEREGLSAWGGGEAGSCGDSPYLQKLPPVLRRSVSGTTGPRHHTRTVYAGERERDGTPVAGSR